VILNIYYIYENLQVCIIHESSDEYCLLFFPVVTIYATLGEEAIAHGINETEVSVVITSHDLLPKFRNILSKTPKVQKLIYMEDQLAKTDVSGYKSGVDIIPFSEVLKTGASSDICKFQNLLLLTFK
jgi:Long-chain acyl-CoA synthetases (AMP-forming)